MSSESKFPVNIVDINSGLLQLAATEAFERFDEPEKGLVPLTEKSYDLLTAFLANPFSLDGYRGNVSRARTANFVWRLGIAHNMSRLVLTHAHDVLSMDPGIVDNVDGSQVAYELLRSDPEALRGPRTHDESTLWQLMDYEPGAETVDYKSTMTAVQVLSHATYVPAHVLEDIRTRRDTTATMTHESPLSLAFNGHEMAVETDHVSEREKELREAQVRVMCGAFVAAHALNEADRLACQEALADFAYRSLRDSEGLYYAFETAGLLGAMSRSLPNKDQAAVQLLKSQIGSFIESFDVRDVAAMRLCEIVEVARELQEIPGLQAFIGRSYAALKEHAAFVKLTADPATETTAEAIPSPSVMLAISRSAGAKYAIEALLRAKEADVLTDQSVLGDLREHGYTYTSMSQAINIIGAELDPNKRRSLTLQFDEAIGQALQNLPDDHPIRQEGLIGMDSEVNHVAYLAYFKSGRQFLDTMLQQFVKQTEGQLAAPEPWKGWRHPADYAAAHCLQTIHNTLWHNRYHYMPEGDQPALERYLMTFAAIVDFVIDKGESPGALSMIKEAVQGLGGFKRVMEEPSYDPQTLAALDPIEAILARYAAISKA